MPTCFYCLGNHETSQCITHATDRIASREKDIQKGIEQLGYQSLQEIQHLGNTISSGLESIQYAIADLQDFLDWAHSETMWALEKQIALLTGIHDMIKNPRATEANELYKMARDSFRRRRYDDALNLLRDARQLNPGDYRIHITVGHIYVRKDDLPNALDSFLTACDYARSEKYKRDALLLAARAQRCLGRFNDSCDIIRQVIKLAPTDWTVKYELASTIAGKSGR